ncbi:MAG: serine/threonine-protein kinase [Planctomycetota bacterium]
MAAAERIGAYEILRLLGSGSQGDVFLARDARSMRRVALKVLTGAPSAHAVTRLRHEAMAIARLRHAAFAEVLEAVFEGPRPYLAMRHVEGVALSDARSARACPVELFASDAKPVPADFLRWFESVSRAVHVAHKAGVVHADLHPGNLMIATDGAPVVLDFGTARVDGLASVTRTGLALGRARFAAPEVLLGRRADARSDVFSIGAVMADCLAVQGAVDPRRSIGTAAGEDLRLVLGKATAAAPEDRFASALELAQELFRLRAGEAIRTGRPGVLRTALRQIRRSPGPMLAALVLTSALVLVWSTWSGTMRARLRVEAASERGRSLLSRLADEWGAEQFHASALSARSGEGGDGGDQRLGGLELEILRLLRRAGRFPEARGLLDADSLGPTTVAEASFERALLAYDRGAVVDVPAVAAGPLGAFVAGLRAMQMGEPTTAIARLAAAVEDPAWPLPTMQDEARLLAGWLALDEEHAATPSLLQGLPPADAGVVGAIGELLRGRAILRDPNGDVEVAYLVVRRALAGLVRLLGEEHVWVLRGERAVAMVASAQGEHGCATQICAGLVPRQVAVHGEAHLEVVRTRLLEWRSRLAFRGGEAEAAIRADWAACPRSPATERLLAVPLLPDGAVPAVRAPARADRHLDELLAVFRAAEGQSAELARAAELALPAERDARWDVHHAHEFDVVIPAHLAHERAKFGEASPQHLGLLAGVVEQMARGHRELQSIQYARTAMAIVLRHGDRVDPIAAGLVECMFVRATLEHRSRSVDPRNPTYQTADLIEAMRAALARLRGHCDADDPRVDAAVKSFADMLGNHGDRRDAQEAMMLYEELRSRDAGSRDKTIWCAEAALRARDVERLSHYLELVDRIAGPRPAQSDCWWDYCDQLRSQLEQLRAAGAPGR